MERDRQGQDRERGREHDRTRDAVDRRTVLAAVGAGVAGATAGCSALQKCDPETEPHQFDGRAVRPADLPDLPLGSPRGPIAGVPFTIRLPEQMVDAGAGRYALNHTCTEISEGERNCACSTLAVKQQLVDGLEAPYAVDGPSPNRGRTDALYQPTGETVSYDGEEVRLWLARPDWQATTGDGEHEKVESLLGAFPRSGATPYVGVAVRLELDYGPPYSPDGDDTVELTTDLLATLHRGLLRIVRTVEPAG